MKKIWKISMALALAATSAWAGMDAPIEDAKGDAPPPCRELKRRGPSPETRAEFQEIRQLGEAARKEADEAKKAEIVAQLREKLNVSAEQMQKRQEKRLAEMEARVARQQETLTKRLDALKAVLANSQAHRAEWIDEQVERILSGNPPRRAPMRLFENGENGPTRGPEGMREGNRQGERRNEPRQTCHERRGPADKGCRKAPCDGPRKMDGRKGRGPSAPEAVPPPPAEPEALPVDAE